MAAIQPKRALKGDAWAQAEGAGILRRLGQGANPLKSPLTRAALGLSPVAYWPLEDEAGSTQFASAVAGGTPMVVGSGEPVYGDDTTLGGSPRAPKVHDGTTPVFMTGNTPGATSATGWTFAFWFRVNTDAVFSILEPIRVRTTDPALRNFIVYTQSTNVVVVNAYDEAGNFSTIQPAVTSTNFHDGTWHMVMVTAAQSGSSVDVRLRIDGTAYTVLDSDTYNLGRITSVNAIRPDGTGALDVDGAWMSHIGVWDYALSAAQADALYEAGTGYSGEPAAERMQRLCDEEGVPFSVFGEAGETQPMGPQRPDTLLNLLTEAERTDGGQLFEPRSSLSLAYRTLASMYNQDPALELDFDAAEVAPPFEPKIDDQATRNDVTATRPAGGSARVAQESGPLNVNDPRDDPNGVGRYETQIDVNPEDPNTLAQMASWRKHLGTIDEARYPRVTVDLVACPHLEGAASAVDIGDRIMVANPPGQPDDASLIVLGLTEVNGTHRRSITFNCVPESAYRVGVATNGHGLLGSGGSTVASAFTTGTNTALSVALAAGTALWDDLNAPFDIIAGGARLTVLSVSGTSSPQTLTVVATPVNGVVKALQVGDRVELADLKYIGL